MKKKMIVNLVLMIVIVLLVIKIMYPLFEQNTIDKTFYQFKSEKVAGNTRIIQLTDLHLKEFGEKNSNLVEEVRRLSPDIIAITGDMNLEKNNDYSIVLTLCEQLLEIAPVYYCPGNHETTAWFVYNSDIMERIKETGVQTVIDQIITVELPNGTFDIGGLIEDPEHYEQYGMDFMESFLQKENFKLLLVHYPEYFLESYKYCFQNYDIDLALAGHAHGGQIRIPGIGGLFTVKQGVFPKLTEGYHRFEESALIISRGLGNSNLFPRINNRPEIVIIDINWY